MVRLHYNSALPDYCEQGSEIAGHSKAWRFLTYWVTVSFSGREEDIHTGPVGTGGPLSRLRREAGTGVKNAWSYISIPTYIIMAWCLISPALHRDIRLTHSIFWKSASHLRHSHFQYCVFQVPMGASIRGATRILENRIKIENTPNVNTKIYNCFKTILQYWIEGHP
jgi:hypothetical protein